MGYIIYPLGEAKEKYADIVTRDYDKQRNDLYSELRNKNINASNFLTQENFNKINIKNEELYNSLIKELNEVKPTTTERGSVLTGGKNDKEIIENLLAALKSLKVAETFEQFNDIIKILDNANNFIKKNFKNKLSKNMFSIATNDYEKLKKAIEIANKENDIKIIRDQVKDSYSKLIGNLGESLGILYSHTILSKELQQQLKKEKISIKIANAGGDVVENKRAVGDTKIEFIYNGKRVLGSIGMSNKLSGEYGLTNSHTIKLRGTNINQVNNEDIKPGYYNLVSYHAEGENHKLNLVPTDTTLSFRQYIASIVLTETLFGSFKGDNVYYFNYGEYLLTMNNLLDQQIGGKGVPYMSLPEQKERDKALQPKVTPEEAEIKVGTMPLLIYSTIHFVNLVNSLQGTSKET